MSLLKLPDMVQIAPMEELFVGRAAELGELINGLERALTGSGQFFLISGGPGIGKTTLAAELSAVADGRRRATGLPARVSVHWGQCWHSGAPPYWPWTRIASSLAAGLATPTARELESLLSAPPEETGEPSAQSRFAFFDRASSLLRQTMLDAPQVLVFDDLHLCDLPSLSLLHFVARDLGRMRVLIIATVRESETEIDARRARAIADIGRWGKRLPLRGLTEMETSELILRAFAVQPARPLVHRIHELSEGNPFFIDEIARVLRSRQLLQSPDAAIEIPREVRNVIAQHLELLTESDREILGGAAVIGRELDEAMLRIAVAADDAAFRSAIDSGEKFHILTRDAGRRDRLRFTHRLLSEALYDRLPVERRQEIHRKLATALEQRATSSAANENALTAIAYHYARSGESAADHAIEYARRAGEKELATYAYESAAEQFATALAGYTASGRTEPALECDLLLGRGEAQARAMESAEARELLVAAAEIARRNGFGARLARAALAIGNLELGVPRGYADEALVALLEEALSQLGETEASLRVQLMSRLAVELHYSDAIDRRDALTSEAIRLARQIGDEERAGLALSHRHFALWNVLDSVELMGLAREVIRQGQRHGNLELEIQGRTWAAIDGMVLGNGAEVDHDLEIFSARAEALRQPRYLGLVALFSGIRALWRGRFLDAHDLAQRAVAAGERVGRPDTFGNAALLRVAILREQGQMEDADNLVRLVLLRAPEIPVVRCMAAMMDVEMGRTDEARAALVSLAERHRRHWSSGHWRSSLIGCLSHVCAFVGDTDRAEWLYDLALPHAGTNVVAGMNAFFGPFDYHLGVLAGVLGREDRALEHFEAAIAQSRASNGLPYLVRSQLADARCRMAIGGAPNRRRAATMLDEALAIAESIGAASQALAVRSARDECGAPTSILGQPTAGADAVFQRNGEYWTIGFAGRIGRLRDSKGLRYICELLRHPGQEIHVAELAASVDSAESPGLRGLEIGPGMAVRRGRLGGSTAVLSQVQREQIADLADRLEIARDLGDTDRIHNLEDQLRQVVAVHSGSSDRAQERTQDVVRQNVSRAIKSAIEKIGLQNPDLKLYLNATIRKGQFCIYQADRRIPVRWKF